MGEGGKSVYHEKNCGGGEYLLKVWIVDEKKIRRLGEYLYNQREKPIKGELFLEQKTNIVRKF